MLAGMPFMRGGARKDPAWLDTTNKLEQYMTALTVSAFRNHGPGEMLSSSWSEGVNAAGAQSARL
jgi:hypothetical protein